MEFQCITELDNVIVANEHRLAATAAADDDEGKVIWFSNDDWWMCLVFQSIEPFLCDWIHIVNYNPAAACIKYGFPKRAKKFTKSEIIVRRSRRFFSEEVNLNGDFVLLHINPSSLIYFVIFLAVVKWRQLAQFIWIKHRFISQLIQVPKKREKLSSHKFDIIVCLQSQNIFKIDDWLVGPIVVKLE